MRYSYGTNSDISITNVVYLIVSVLLFFVVARITKSGIWVIGDFIIELYGSIDFYNSTIDTFFAIFRGDNRNTIIFCTSFIQTFFISRFISKIDDNSSGISELIRTVGDAFLTCLFMMSYNTLSTNFLLKIQSGIFIVLGILLVLGEIITFRTYKISFGLLLLVLTLFDTWGMKHFGYDNMIYVIVFDLIAIIICFINPVTSGLICAFLPLILEIIVFIELENVLGENRILISLISLMISIPLSRILSRITDALLDAFSWNGLPLIDIFFITGSLILMAVWFLCVVFVPKLSTRTVYVDGRTIELQIKDIEERGICSKEVSWEYYSNGVFLIYDSRRSKIMYYPNGHNIDVSYYEKFLEKHKNEIVYVIIEGTVWEIGHGAFAGCNNLKEIQLPRDLTIIDYSAFDGCTSLKEIVIEEDNPELFSEHGKIYNKKSGELLFSTVDISEDSITGNEAIEDSGNSAINNETIEISDCFEMTCSEAAEYLHLNKEIRDGNVIRYIKEEDELSENCTTLVSWVDKKNQKGFWNLFINDEMYSFCGVTLGMNSMDAHNILLSKNWEAICATQRELEAESGDINYDNSNYSLDYLTLWKENNIIVQINYNVIVDYY